MAFNKKFTRQAEREDKAQSKETKEASESDSDTTQVLQFTDKKLKQL